MGIENVFTGPENKPDKSDWDGSDYKSFFDMLPNYFTDTDDQYYKVGLDLMLADVSDEELSFDRVREAIRENLLIQGSYSDRTLSALKF